MENKDFDSNDKLKAYEAAVQFKKSFLEYINNIYAYTPKISKVKKEDQLVFKENNEKIL